LTYIRFNIKLFLWWHCRWCPCFLSFLVSTLPSLWLLQLSQYEAAVSGESNNGTTSNTPSQSNSTTPDNLLFVSTCVRDAFRLTTTKR